MSVICRDIIGIMEEYANPDLAENWDNVGLILGNENESISKILVALDVDDNVIDEAILKKCQMIITHHPFIFKGIKSIRTSDTIGARIIKLIKNDISVFSAHTNLDIAKNGTNDTFANLLNLKGLDNLFPPKEGEFGLGRVGSLTEKVTFSALIDKVKEILNIKNLVVCGDLNRKVQKIGICTGSGGELDFILQAISKNCDVYITGDVKYHNSQVAKDLGICIIDATHYASEVIVLPTISQYINNCAKRLNMELECIISEVNGQTLLII